MTKLTREQVEAMLAGATPGKRCQFHPGYCAEAEGTPFSEWDTSHDISVIRPDGRRVRLAQYKHADDAALSQAAPDLARELLAAWDREAKLREPLGDGWKRVTAVSDIPLDQLLDGEEPPAGQWRHMAVRLDDDMFYTVAFGDTP